MTISQRIKEDVTTRLQGGENLPYKLTLSAISAYYKVSLTPVRRAINELVEGGIIHRLGNGRLEMATKKGKLQLASNNETEVFMAEPHRELDDLIRKEVIGRSLDQDTEYMREQATAEKYGAGRTVVRQVFSRLAGAGLLEHVPRCGWRVLPFSEKDMLDYLVIRETLELKALDLARPYYDEKELRKLLAHNKPGRGKRKSQLDLDMHDYWIARCQNRYIQDFFERYSVFYNTIFNYAVIDERVKRNMAKEHCVILECLIEKNWRGARKALSLHIGDQQDNVYRMIESLARKRA